MKLITLARIGRDAEVRTVGQDIVVNLSLVYNYGRKGEDSRRPSQWVDGAFWGERAKKMAPYLLKGQQILVELSDVHIETYQTRDGAEGSKLSGRVDNIDFAGPLPGSDGGQQQRSEPSRQASAPQASSAPAPQRQAAPQRNAAPAPRGGSGGAGSGFDDFDSDIPFISQSFLHDEKTSKSRRINRCEF